MTLAEIIAEGERLEADVQAAIDLRMPSLADVAIRHAHEFRIEHGPRLLSACKGAIEMREQMSGGDSRCRAFDAVAGGAK